MKFLIWGTGNIAKLVWNNGVRGEMLGFIETLKNKDEYMGYPVYNVEEIPEEYDFIIVANSFSEEIYGICKNSHIDLNKTIFMRRYSRVLFNDNSCVHDMLGEKNYADYAEEYHIWDGPFIKEMIKHYPQGFISWGGGRDGREKFFCGKQYYSQCYQDFFLDKFLFDNVEKGFFLDVGGNHPTYINNTYFFEKKGWDGLAIEPMPKMNALWKKERKTHCMQLAVGNQNCMLEFKEYDKDYMSGIADRVDFDGEVKEVYSVQCRKLGDILEEHSITEVDFMSLDVEGYELEVLEGIDFNSVFIKCIVLENNHEEREDMIRDYLLKKGYRLFAKLWFDDVWVRD